MEVDARLFALASEKAGGEMYFPGPEELEEYDVVTPAGFDHFRLEPYGSGIVAVSERLEPTGYRDPVTDLVAFCSDGVPKLMLTAETPNGLADGMEFLAAGLRFEGVSDTPIDGARIATWGEEAAGRIQFELTRAEAGQALGAACWRPISRRRAPRAGPTARPSR